MRQPKKKDSNDNTILIAVNYKKKNVVKKPNKSNKSYKSSATIVKPKKLVIKKSLVKRNKQTVGSSHLEERFKTDFLDKLGIKYVQQFEAKSIGRFFDFYLPNSNLIIEIDGDYWHCNPDKYKDGPINQMQKKNQRIDELKNKWALTNGIPIMRIWENDINHNPESVMERLRDRLNLEIKKNKLLESKKLKKNKKNI